MFILTTDVTLAGVDDVIVADASVRCDGPNSRYAKTILVINNPTNSSRAGKQAASLSRPRPSDEHHTLAVCLDDWCAEDNRASAGADERRADLNALDATSASRLRLLDEEPAGAERGTALSVRAECAIAPSADATRFDLEDSPAAVH